MADEVNKSKAKKFGKLNKNSYVPVGKEIIMNKNYLVGVRAFIDNRCEMIDDKRIISKSSLDSIMSGVFGLRKRKAKKVLDVYRELGVISEYDNEHWVVNFLKPFVTLDPETVEYCLNALSDTSFKVYCYLKSAYSYHVSKYPDLPFTFSVSGKDGLLERCGYYGDNNHNRKMMNQILETLREVKLIEITDPFPVRDADGVYKGWYRQLIGVYDRSSPQMRVELQDYEENHKYSDYYAYAPRPMYVGDRKCLYDKAAFNDHTTLSRLLEDDRNYDALNDGLIFEDVPKASQNRVESVLREWEKLESHRTIPVSESILGVTCCESHFRGVTRN